MTTTATLAGLSDRLRAQARFQSVAYYNLGKPVAPDDTPQGQAATAIEALLARIAALTEALEKISDQPNTGLIASVVEAKRIARAALTLKENDA